MIRLEVAEVILRLRVGMRRGEGGGLNFGSKFLFGQARRLKLTKKLRRGL